MHHVFYSDGNAKKISWRIETNDSVAEQHRDHVDIYLDRVTELQSKYIALHVGLFWGIGVFIIKDGDSVRIKLDEKMMYEHFTSNSSIEDELIKKRMQFIQQLIKQRQLKTEFEFINASENLASKNT